MLNLVALLQLVSEMGHKMFRYTPKFHILDPFSRSLWSWPSPYIVESSIPAKVLLIAIHSTLFEVSRFYHLWENHVFHFFDHFSMSSWPWMKVKVIIFGISYKSLLQATIMPNMEAGGLMAFEKIHFFTFLTLFKVTTTLDKGQGHNVWYSLKALVIIYNHAEYGSKRRTGLWENPIFHFFGPFSRSLQPWVKVKVFHFLLA